MCAREDAGLNKRKICAFTADCRLGRTPCQVEDSGPRTPDSASKVESCAPLDSFDSVDFLDSFENNANWARAAPFPLTIHLSPAASGRPPTADC